jgi:hypothetical protein
MNEDQLTNKGTTDFKPIREQARNERREWLVAAIEELNDTSGACIAYQDELQILDLHDTVEKLTEGTLLLNKMRETLAKCANPDGGPLAMAPERIVAYVEHLREREFDATRLLHRARQAEMDRDDAFGYIHALWRNGQLPEPMTDSLRARVQRWGDPEAQRVEDNA